MPCRAVILTSLLLVVACGQELDPNGLPDEREDADDGSGGDDDGSGGSGDVGTGDGSGGVEGGGGGGDVGTGGESGSGGGDNGQGDGCPENSTLDGEYCSCDEGYVVNAAGDGCEPGESGSGGCPPNSHADGEYCYCDEGYVVNAAGTGCEPGQSGGGGGCPPNSHLEGSSCYCDEGFVVNGDQTACVHQCETNADCAGGLVCEDFECAEAPCTPTSCPNGFLCSSSGSCVMDIGTPPAGTPPVSCANIPSWECSGDEAYCGALVTFNPRLGDGYWDYPLNGETTNDQYRSYIRRDVMLAVKYAAASVRCLAEGWTVGNGGELGLGDMSEQNGAIPGTSDGQPGHPAGTHVDGHDMDVAYFQTGTADNTLRPVCPHTAGGQDAYHCTGEPNLLDVWRTAAFIAKLHDTPQLRVIGVDGKVGPKVESAVDQLCGDGWLTGNACDDLALAYETTNTGQGWYQFHHHHLHMSFLNRAQAGLGGAYVMPPRGKDACLSLDCALPSLDVDPRRVLYRPLKVRIAE